MEHCVTGAALRRITKKDFELYGITKLGHKLRLLRDLEDIKELYKEDVEPVSASLTSVDSNLSGTCPPPPNMYITPFPAFSGDASGLVCSIV